MGDQASFILMQAGKYLLLLSKQLLRSGTSIGANIEEALGGFSRKEFSAKMAIAYKGARKKLIRILASIVKTSRAVKG